MYTDKQGAQAIIDLQRFAGIKEPVERAVANWKAFGEREKRATENAHMNVTGGKFGTEMEESGNG